MDKLIIKSIALASFYHKNQMYGDEPYMKHLLDVYEIIQGYYPDDYILQASAILHDVIEDSYCTYHKIKTKINAQVADIIYDVTDELGKNRKERKLKTYPKIKCNINAIIIKLADRIANIEYSKLHGSDQYNMYLKEHDEFKKELYLCNYYDHCATLLWTRLEKSLGLIE